MKKSIFTFFWISLAIGLGVLGWLTYSILELDRKRNEELRQSRIEEQTRLALWRMDSALGKILSEENKRSPQDFFEQAECEKPDYVVTYFQIKPDGALSMTDGKLSGKGELVEMFKRTLNDIGQLRGRSVPELILPAEPSNDAVTNTFRFSIQPEEPEQKAIETAYDQSRTDSQQALPQQISKDYLARAPQPRTMSSSQLSQELLPQQKQNDNPPSPTAAPSKPKSPPTDQVAAAGTVATWSAESKNRGLPLPSASPMRYMHGGTACNDLDGIVMPDLVKAHAKTYESDSGAATGQTAETGKTAPLLARPDEVSLEIKDEKSFGLQYLSDKSIAPSLTEPFSLLDKKNEDSMTRQAGLSAADDDSIGQAGADDLMTGEVTSKEKSSETEEAPEAYPPVNFRHPPLSISTFSPKWINNQLVLLRTVANGTETYTQGVWVDWQKLSLILLESARDILPQASLAPFTESTVTPRHVARMLAGIPILVTPGSLPPPAPAGINTLSVTLVLAWAFAAIAAAGVVTLLLGMLKLNERRATFVSAVTHELRTPLTTFNLYTEMLMHGMVPKENFKDYISTLQQEASRLTHLVDNVLSFSRIEKSTAKSGLTLLTGKLLQQNIVRNVMPILERAGMTLKVDSTPSSLKASLLTNLPAVEQIMVNLADNTAKYARELSEKAELKMDIKGRHLRITFKDFGRGIPPAMKERLFTPFSRSAEDAAGDKPGIGLGLALSREIAQKLGGELVYDKSHANGTCFHLLLPLRR